jgi:hypothetical protein
MLVFDRHLADKGLLRTPLLAGIVLLSTTVASGQAFSDCAQDPFWGMYANQVVVSNGSTTTPTCDLLYKAISPSTFTVSSQLPPGTSAEWAPNGVFSFMNVYANSATYTGMPATVWVQKGVAQDGIAIIDDNSNDTAAPWFGPASSLDIALYHVPANYPASRYGIHVTVDASSGQDAPGKLYAAALGAHAQYSTGLEIEASGPESTSIFTFEGDGTETEASYNTTAHQIIHLTNGYIFNVSQQVSNMTGDVLLANMASGSGTSAGTFSGNFLNFLNAGQQEFKVDAQGNVYVPSIKANSGTRFVCVDTTGKLISQTTPCSGT